MGQVTRVIDKLLIANRGEIACRVIRTAKRLGLRTVAVYSDADAAALHVTMADEAYRLGPAPARESYLVIDAILAAAKASGAQAIHPGYGFLSENADFAAACAAAGVIFVGPPASAIRAMGDKAAAKTLMADAGVPIVPGYHCAAQDLETLRRSAADIGYPVLIKAAAGGGGKGMRVVTDAPAFDEAVGAAKREAKAAFGDDRVILERYLTQPRHIEVQVFADTHGNAVYLFERDCSLQRRHQKVIEEAPAPGMTEARRQAMGGAAVKAALAVGYVGAGTVEFIADPGGEFFFMEMNTRLQVEHPVTEMISGQDLVEWQLKVAAGEKLPLTQADLRLHGHAIEARLYAEDPVRDFLPATGRLTRLRFPEESPHVRVDAGVSEGDQISIHYDPMIAKLIVWEHSRAAALRRLRQALAACEIAGLATNVAFLAAVARHEAFAAGAVDTGFIARHRADLVPEPAPASDQLLALATLAVLLDHADRAATQALGTSDPYSPWALAEGWRLNEDAHHTLGFHDGLAAVSVTAHYRRHGFVLDLPGGSLEVQGDLTADGRLSADLGGVRVNAAIVRRAGEITVITDGHVHRLTMDDPLAAAWAAAGADAGLTAPMPGRIVAVRVEAGATVERGQPLLTLEAMKMEHTIKAPTDGLVEAIHFAVGEQVEEGIELIAFKPAEES